MRLTLFVLLFAGAHLWPADVAASGCPEASEARLAGNFPAAEAAARHCQDRDPRDVGVWFELSRALGYQKHYDEALHWAERGLERYPQDADMAVWRVRLLAWSGSLPEARTAMNEVVARAPVVRQDPETAMLEVDLSFWGEDWETAAAGFSRYLERWPDDAEAYRKRGISWLNSGREARALDDFEQSCGIGGGAQPSCLYAEDLRRRTARVEVGLDPSYATSDGGDEVITRLTAMVRVWRELRLGLRGELRIRDGGAGAVQDNLAYFLATWRAPSWSAEAGVGMGFDPIFSPQLTAWVEPAFEIAEPLWAHLRYWRLDFADGGAHVISPAANLYFGAWNIEARYYLGIEDAGGGSHAGLVRARWTVAPEWTLEAGGGAGDAADYLQVRDTTIDGHWLALGGVRWAPDWRHRFSLGYVFRQEGADGRTRERHEVVLGYRFSL